MALRVELKPYERIVIGKSVITNSETRAVFLIDGETPILREKDILTADTANTPVRRIYLCVQMMYLEKDIPKYQELYLGFIKELLEAGQGNQDLPPGASQKIIDALQTLANGSVDASAATKATPAKSASTEAAA